MKIIDMHADTLSRIKESDGKIELYENNLMVDIKKLNKVNSFVQFFSTFMRPEFESRSTFEKIYSIYLDELKKNADIIAPLLVYSDIEKNEKEGKISSLLTLEGAMIIAGEMEYLEELFDLGIRLVTLTWNHETCMGYPCSDKKNKMKLGLKHFGFEAIEKMNNIGLIIDVSHLSDGGFWDVKKISSKPFVASHSNARALTNVRRNLSDEMLIAIAESGGVVGINIFPGFLDMNDMNNPYSKVEYMIAHISHIQNIAGIDIVAIGSDFDGISGNMEIEHIGQIDKLEMKLRASGYSSSAIEKIFYRNAHRVIKDIIL
ncbi:MAG: dipeptidase [Clostridiales bacterium]|nr:dipeptidase [Clostridiales bacterium]